VLVSCNRLLDRMVLGMSSLDIAKIMDFEVTSPGNDEVIIKFCSNKRGPWVSRKVDAYDAMALGNRLQAAARRAFPGNAVTFSKEDLKKASKED
jgi:hypothetical protein